MLLRPVGIGCQSNRRVLPWSRLCRVSLQKRARSVKSQSVVSSVRTWAEVSIAGMIPSRRAICARCAGLARKRLIILSMIRSACESEIKPPILLAAHPLPERRNPDCSVRRKTDTLHDASHRQHQGRYTTFFKLAGPIAAVKTTENHGNSPALKQTFAGNRQAATLVYWRFSDHL